MAFVQSNGTLRVQMYLKYKVISVVQQRHIAKNNRQNANAKGRYSIRRDGRF